MPTLWGLAAELKAVWAPLIGIVMVVMLTSIIGWLVFIRSDLDEEEIISLAIIGSLLITPYAWAYEHVILLIPLVILLAKLADKQIARLIWIVLVILVPWILYRISIGYGYGTPEVALPILTVMLFGFYMVKSRKVAITE